MVFKHALEKIAGIKKAGIRSVIMTTVSGANIEEIPAIIDTVAAHKVDVSAFARYCPASGEKDTDIEPMRYRELFVACDKKFKEYEAAGCNCGNCHLTILPTGDIYACRRVQNSRVANVSRDRIADVWACEMEAYREYGKFKKCGKYELKAWCRGCPAVASGAHGDFYGADPQCWKAVG